MRDKMKDGALDAFAEALLRLGVELARLIENESEREKEAAEQEKILARLFESSVCALIQVLETTHNPTLTSEHPVLLEHCWLKKHGPRPPQSLPKRRRNCLWRRRYGRVHSLLTA